MLSSNISDFIYKFCIILIVVNLILLIIPNSKIKRTLTFVFSCIVILYSITPFLKIAKLDSVKSNYYYDEIELQENYFSYEKTEKKEQIRKVISNCIKTSENTLKNVEVIFKAKSINIEKIKLYFDKQFIIDMNEHIVVIEEIKNRLSNTYLINKEDIEIIYE